MTTLLYLFFLLSCVTAQWTLQTPAASFSARADHHTLVSSSGTVIVTGGFVLNNQVWTSNDTGLSWSLMGGFSTPRRQHQAVQFNGAYYLTGGYKSPPLMVFSDVQVSYNLTEWIPVVQAPTPNSHPQRAEHATVVYQNALWTLGGTATRSTWLNTVFRSTNGSYWQQMTTGSIWGGRGGFGVAILGTQVYVYGGRGTGSTVYRDVWSSSDMLNWSQLTTTAPWGYRFYFGSTQTDRGMFLSGGYDSVGTPYNDMWFSPDGLQWNSLTDTPSWSIRGSHTLSYVSLSQSLLLVAGADNGVTQVNDVHRYHLPDSCSSIPCMNGATCTNLYATYTCTCIPGFSGIRCETNINECSSQPCRNGGTCIDQINRYQCQCAPGYSGTDCQTDMDECSSQPCQHSGGCTDLINGYSCACPNQWTGSQCQVDVNECATQNAGCSSDSLCTNQPGAYNCTAFYTSGSLALPSLPPQPYPLLAPFTQPNATFPIQLVVQTIGHLNSISSIQCPTFGVAFGSPSNPVAFPCTNITVMAWTITNVTIQCYLTQGGCGVDQKIVLYNPLTTNQMWSRGNDSLSFPAPQWQSGSLRLADSNTNQSTIPSFSSLQLPTIFTHRLSFALSHGAYPSYTTVTYGPASQPSLYSCTVVPSLSSFQLVTCDTAALSLGTHLYLTVTVNGQSTLSTETLSFPPVPTIVAVRGCPSVSSSNPNITTDCPTAGQIPVTILGRNLIDPILSVSIGGSACSSPSTLTFLLPNTDLASFTCLLPAGTGFNKRVLVSCGGQTSLDVPSSALSYALPTLQTIRGCTDQPPLYQSTVDCPRLPSLSLPTRLTISGQNFGSQGAIVLIGSVPCANVIHDITSPDSQLQCDLPPGTAVNRPLLLLQLGGGLSSTTSVTLSYHQCPAGQYDHPTLSCQPCLAGTFSNLIGSLQCLSCPVGTAQSVQGQTSCTMCEGGRYQDSTGASRCLSCLVGTYSPLNQTNKACTLCPSGSYSSSIESAKCDLCPAGTSSNTGNDRGGATSCLACTGATYSLQPGQGRCDSCSPSGQFWLEERKECRSCASTAECSLAGIRNHGQVYLYVDRESGEMQSAPCLPGLCVDCPTLFASNATVMACCGPNRLPASENPMCGQCLPGYYNWGSNCLACPRTHAGYVVLFLLLVYFYTTVFHRLAQQTSAEIRVLNLFLQMVYLFLASQAGSLASWLSIFNLNIFAILSGGGDGGTCFGPWTDLQRLAMGLMFPLLGFLCLLLNLILESGVYTCISKKLCHPSETTLSILCCPCNAQPYRDLLSPVPLSSSSQKPASIKSNKWIVTIGVPYRRTALGFAVASYAVVTQTIWTFFCCTPLAGQNQSVLQAFPAVSCLHDEQYLRLYPLFITLAIVVVAIPVILFARLYILNQAGRLYGTSNLKRESAMRTIYGIVSEIYQPSRFYWESVVLVRRLILAAVSLAPSLVNDTSTRFKYLSLVNVLFLALHVGARPFRLPVDNGSETLAQLTLLILTLFLIDTPSPLPLATALGLSLMAFSVGGYFIIRICASRLPKLARWLYATCGLSIASSSTAAVTTASSNNNTRTSPRASIANVVVTSAGLPTVTSPENQERRPSVSTTPPPPPEPTHGLPMPPHPPRSEPPSSISTSSDARTDHNRPSSHPRNRDKINYDADISIELSSQ